MIRSVALFSAVLSFLLLFCGAPLSTAFAQVAAPPPVAGSVPPGAPARTNGPAGVKPLPPPAVQPANVPPAVQPVNTPSAATPSAAAPQTQPMTAPPAVQPPAPVAQPAPVVPPAPAPVQPPASVVPPAFVVPPPPSPAQPSIQATPQPAVTPAPPMNAPPAVQSPAPAVSGTPQQILPGATSSVQIAAKKPVDAKPKTNASLAGFVDPPLRPAFTHLRALDGVILASIPFTATYEVFVSTGGGRYSVQTDKTGYFRFEFTVAKNASTASVEVRSSSGRVIGPFNLSIKKGKTSCARIYSPVPGSFMVSAKDGANHQQDPNYFKFRDGVRKTLFAPDKKSKGAASVSGRIMFAGAAQAEAFFAALKAFSQKDAGKKGRKAPVAKGYFFGERPLPPPSEVSIKIMPGDKKAKIEPDGSYKITGPFQAGGYTISTTAPGLTVRERKIAVSRGEYSLDLFGVDLVVNTPPALSQVQVIGSSNEIAIVYSIEDPDRDECVMELYYSTDQGRTYKRTGAFSGDVRTVAPAVGKRLFWNSRSDIERGCHPGTMLRLEANDGAATGPVALSAPFYLNNNHIPIVSSVVAAGSSGEVTITYDLSDGDSEPCRIEVYYSTDRGATYKKTTAVSGDLTGVSPGAGKKVRWASNVDCPENIDTVRLKLSPFDSIDAGQSGFTQLFAVSNNAVRPEVKITAIEGNSNEIRIKYDLIDPDGNDCTVELFLSDAAGADFRKPVNISGNLSGLKPGPGRVISWHSRFDIPENREGIRVKLTARDAMGSGTEEVSAPFAVYNNQPPTVSNIVVTGASEEVIVRYDLTDPEKDNATVEVYYSTDNGATYRRTNNIRGDTVNIAPDINRVMMWKTREEIPGNSPQTKIKIVPHNAVSRGNAGVSSEFFIRNNRAPIVDKVAVTGSSNEIEVAFDLEDPDANESYMELHYSLDGGATYKRSDNIVCREERGTKPRPGKEKAVTPGSGRIIAWSSHRDFRTNQPRVRLKVVANDGFEYGTPGFSGDLMVGNRPLPVASNVMTSGSSGEISITYDLADPENGENSIRVWYSLDGGVNFTKTISVSGVTEKVRSGKRYGLKWKSAADFSSKHRAVVVRIIPNDGNVNGMHCDSPPFFVNNNRRPSVSNVRAAGTAGDAVISYDLSDPDSNECSIEVSYSLDGGKTFKKTEDLTGPFAGVACGRSREITWNSAAAVPGKARIVVRVEASDGYEQSDPCDSAPFELNNAILPKASNVRATPPENGGVYRINYDLSASGDEPSGVIVRYSKDGGKKYLEMNSLSGDTASVTVGRNRKMFWDAAYDLMSDIEGVRIKITPYNKNGVGAPVVSGPFTVRTAPVNVAKAEGFGQRESHAAVSFKDGVYVIGGWAGSPFYKSEIFRSKDLADWEIADSIAFAARHGHTALSYNGRIFVIGGFSAGARNDVWSSADGKLWDENTRGTTESVRFAPRDSHASAVFSDLMWVTGGFGSGYRNDAWCSSSGVSWTCSTTGENSFTPRAGHAAFAFQGRLWVCGGYDGAKYLNDVWRTQDGSRWEKVAQRSPFTPRRGHSVIVSGSRLWLLNGHDDSNFSEVYYSDDAISWKRIPVCEGMSDGPGNRRGQTAVQHDGAIYILGGYDGVSYRSDAWRLPVR